MRPLNSTRIGLTIDKRVVAEQQNKETTLRRSTPEDTTTNEAVTYITFKIARLTEPLPFYFFLILLLFDFAFLRGGTPYRRIFVHKHLLHPRASHIQLLPSILAFI